MTTQSCITTQSRPSNSEQISRFRPTDVYKAKFYHTSGKSAFLGPQKSLTLSI